MTTHAAGEAAKTALDAALTTLATSLAAAYPNFSAFYAGGTIGGSVIAAMGLAVFGKGRGFIADVDYGNGVKAWDLRTRLDVALSKYTAAYAAHDAGVAAEAAGNAAYDTQVASQAALLASQFTDADRDVRALEKELTDDGVDYDPTTGGVQAWPHGTPTTYDPGDPAASVATLDGRAGAAIKAATSPSLATLASTVREAMADVTRTLNHEIHAPVFRTPNVPGDDVIRVLITDVNEMIDFLGFT